MKDRAYAKINLCLDVLRKREDGYHDLEMIMVPLSFYDIIEINRASKTVIKTNAGYLPADEKNTVIKALNSLRRRYGFKEEFEISIIKHIPTQAGLAGGSSDGATAIKMFNKLLNLRMTTEEMLDVALEVGSDVPFFIYGKPAVVKGTGNIIEPFTLKLDFHVFLVKPKKGVSTKLAFEALDFSKCIHPKWADVKEALGEGNYNQLIASLGNTLEEPSTRLVPAIAKVKKELLELGFDGVLMSGSGSTVFGITKDQNIVAKANDVMKEKGYFVRCCKLVDSASS